MLIKNIQKILLLIGCILLLISIYYCNKYVNINNTIENFNDITLDTLLADTQIPADTDTQIPTYTQIPTPTYTIPSITLDSYTSITNPNISSMPSMNNMSSMNNISSMSSMSSMPSIPSMPSMPGGNIPSKLTDSNPTSNNVYISPINNTELYNPNNKLVMS